MADSSKKTENYVAIDVGAYSVKFAYIEQNSEGASVLKALSQIIVPPYEKNLTEEQREQMSRDDVKAYCLKELRQLLTTHITELLYDNEISTKKAVTFASNREVTIRCLEIPSVTDKEKSKLDEAINLEANKQMPFSMGNAVLGYSLEGDIIKEDKPYLQVMAAALQKDTVDHINGNLKGCGLTCDAILTLPQTLLLSLKEQMASFAFGDKKVAIIHCGHTTTSLMIFKNNKVQFYRDINMAGATITDAIYAGGEVDGQMLKPASYDEATELKHRLGVIPPDDIESLRGIEKFAANKIFETVEKIFQNIQLSISFYVSQSGESKGLDKIILSGGTAFMKNFKEFIEESLEVSTSLAEPFYSLKIGDIKYEEQKRLNDSAALSPVLGAGLYQASPDIINFLDILAPKKNKKSSSSTSSINFSSVSSKFGNNLSFNNITTKIFELDENKLRILAGILVVILLIIGAIPVIIINKKLDNVKTEYKKMEKSMGALRAEKAEVQKLMKEQENLAKYADISVHLKEYRQEKSKLIIKLLTSIPEEIFLTKVLFKLSPSNSFVEISGHSDNSDNIFLFLAQLGQTNLFVEPNLKSSGEIKIDKDRYFVSFEVRSNINLHDLYPVEEKKAEDSDEEDNEDDEE